MLPSVVLPSLVTLSAVAGTWSVTDKTDDCTFYRGAERDGMTPVRVVCSWPEADAAQVHAVLSSPERHASVFGGLSESSVIGRAGGSERVYLRYRARGMSDREVVVDYDSSPIDGGRRYWWHKSADQRGLRGDTVQLPMTAGSWEVQDGASGQGVTVAYELRLKLGGAIPGFLVDWAQTGAVADSLGELRRRVTQ